MNVSELTLSQKQALLDLLIIAMYADGHLALAEDARIQRLLDSFEFDSPHARQQFTDAAFTRASRHAQSPSAARSHVEELSAQFPAKQSRRQAVNAVEGLLASDGRFTGEEKAFLNMIREVFQME